MIYRVTARFLQAFDALDGRAQSQALRALRQFKHSPRQPAVEARIISPPDPRQGTAEDDIWDLPFGNGYHLTYSFASGEHPDHFVCVLRNVGLAPDAPEARRR